MANKIKKRSLGIKDNRMSCSNAKNRVNVCRNIVTKVVSTVVSMSLITAMMPQNALAAEPTTFITTANPNHWGRSDLRGYLNGTLKSGNSLPIDTTKHNRQSSSFYESQFTDGEYTLIKPWTYKTNVLGYGEDGTVVATSVYETTDKFVLPSGNTGANNGKDTWDHKSVISWGDEDISADSQYNRSIKNDKGRLIPVSYWSVGNVPNPTTEFKESGSAVTTRGDASLRSAFCEGTKATGSKRGATVWDYAVDNDKKPSIATVLKVDMKDVVFASAASTALFTNSIGSKKLEIIGAAGTNAGFGDYSTKPLPNYGMYLKTKLDDSFEAKSLQFDNGTLNVNYTGGTQGIYVVVHAFKADDLGNDTCSYVASASLQNGQQNLSINVSEWKDSTDQLISSLDGYTVKVWMEKISDTGLQQATTPQTFVASGGKITETTANSATNLRVFSMKQDLQTSWGDLRELNDEEFNKVITCREDVETLNDRKIADGEVEKAIPGLQGKNPTNQKIYYGKNANGPLEFWIAGREKLNSDNSIGELDPNGDVLCLYQAQLTETKKFNENKAYEGTTARVLQLEEGQVGFLVDGDVSFIESQTSGLDYSDLKWQYREPGTSVWMNGTPLKAGEYEIRAYVEGTGEYERTYSAVVNYTLKEVKTPIEDNDVVNDGTNDNTEIDDIWGTDLPGTTDTKKETTTSTTTSPLKSADLGKTDTKSIKTKTGDSSIYLEISGLSMVTLLSLVFVLTLKKKKFE